MDLAAVSPNKNVDDGAIRVRVSPGSQGHEVPVNLVDGRTILFNPNQRTQMKDSMDLVELARQVQTADNFTKANATSKLTIIVDQIRYLQEQARKVLLEARQNNDLHHVPCNFKKVPGKMYYLYEKPASGQKLFSMLSPQEWGASCPYAFLGSYKLQYDMSWTPVDQLHQKEQDLDLINQILMGNHRSEKDPLAFSITESIGDNDSDGGPTPIVFETH